jgi:hypothetical protein
MRMRKQYGSTEKLSLVSPGSASGLQGGALGGSYEAKVKRNRKILVFTILASLLGSLTGARSAVARVAPAPLPPASPAASPAASSAGSPSSGPAVAGSSNPRSSNPYLALKAPKTDGRLHLVLASPKGQLRLVTKSTELRWVFDRPIIALSTIDQRAPKPRATQSSISSLANSDLTKYVHIEPAIEGSFRWSSTRVLVRTNFRLLLISRSSSPV